MTTEANMEFGSFEELRETMFPEPDPDLGGLGVPVDIEQIGPDPAEVGSEFGKRLAERLKALTGEETP
jgi:hypothetical protein